MNNTTNSVFLTLGFKSLNKTIDQKVDIKYVSKKCACP